MSYCCIIYYFVLFVTHCLSMHFSKIISQKYKNYGFSLMCQIYCLKSSPCFIVKYIQIIGNSEACSAMGITQTVKIF